jgi:transposase
MGSTQTVLGIDISKQKFDVCLTTTAGGKERYRTFKNTAAGFNELAAFLKLHGAASVHACMEPTGRFCEGLALWLREQKHKVSIVNAYRIKGFAISELKRSKTDRIDAGIIARFCLMHNPEVWTPREDDLQEMHDIGRYVDELTADLVREKNRLKSGIENALVVKEIENHIRYLEKTIERLDKRMRTLVKSNDRLEKAFKCATSVIGVGERLAFTFLGEIGYGDQFLSTRQVEAFCGLNPRLRTSGTTLNSRPKMSKMGSSRMRRALYMPALSSMQHNPILRDFADRLRAAGKHPRAIVGAVMRKLLRMLFAVVKTGTPYDLEFHGRPRLLGGNETRSIE